MSIETEVSELNVGLRELEIFLTVFDEFAKNSTFTEHLDYVNGVISMISMQSAKIRNLIDIAEEIGRQIGFIEELSADSIVKEKK